ncbi:MAG: methylenetetrahydrofolate reductase [NAD(P)H] [Gammaproteobacteria bacterium]|nr:MAG: methylenetetrahydrofolate reductase [NAD(P)H] [Gammaproteobacteria bacterium]
MTDTTSTSFLTPHPSLSFEFFPPKTDKGRENLKKTLTELGKLGPEYFSVTYGAGGSTREGTVETIRTILDAGFEAAPHIACIGSSREEIRSLLDEYKAMGVKRVVALRGDLPSGMGVGQYGDFQFATELVRFIREESGDVFKIEVAAYPEFHPQSPTAREDLLHFREKVEAGADEAITQYFYNADAYVHFVESVRKMGVETPIVPGIMPISNFQQLSRFSAACGAEIPRWLRKRMEGYGDEVEKMQASATDVVARLSRQLLDAGAPGLHFYTMNKVEPTREICQRLGW